MGLNPRGTEADPGAADDAASREPGADDAVSTEPEAADPATGDRPTSDRPTGEPSTGEPPVGELHAPTTTFGGHQMAGGTRSTETPGNPTSPEPTAGTTATTPSRGLGSAPRTPATHNLDARAAAAGIHFAPASAGVTGAGAGKAKPDTEGAEAAQSITATPMPAHTHELERRLLADPNLLDDIAFAVGGPFHVMYPEQVADNIRGFRAAFTAAGVDGAIFYGKKANKADCVTRVCADQGVGVDVSSVGELTAALAQGVRGADLMVTGPAKSDELLRLGARHNALIAIDTPDELDRLATPTEHPGPARILLRVQPSGSPSRFGMTEAELDQAISRLAPPVRSTPRGPVANKLDYRTAPPDTFRLHATLAEPAERLGLSRYELDCLVARIAPDHSHRTATASPGSLHVRTRLGGSLDRLGLTSDEFAAMVTHLGMAQLGSAPIAHTEHAAADRIAPDRILLEGFSFHLSGYDPIARAELALALVDRVLNARAKGHPVTTISIGGGFGVDYVPAAAWTEFTEQVDQQWFHSGKTFNSYYPYHCPAPGPAMLTTILEHHGLAQRLRDNTIRLAIEPGRALLDRAGSTVFRVQGRKTRTAQGQSYDLLTVDGTSLSLSEQWFDSEYLPDPVLWPSRPGGSSTPSSVGAASCLESDMLSWRRIPLPRRAEVGDLLVYPNTAGYQMDSNESAFHELPIPPKVVLHDLGARLRWTLDPG